MKNSTSNKNRVRAFAQNMLASMLLLLIALTAAQTILQAWWQAGENVTVTPSLNDSEHFTTQHLSLGSQIPRLTPGDTDSRAAAKPVWTYLDGNDWTWERASVSASLDVAIDHLAQRVLRHAATVPVKNTIPIDPQFINVDGKQDRMKLRGGTLLATKKRDERQAMAWLIRGPVPLVVGVAKFDTKRPSAAGNPDRVASDTEGSRLKSSTTQTSDGRAASRVWTIACWGVLLPHSELNHDADVSDAEFSPLELSSGDSRRFRHDGQDEVSDAGKSSTQGETARWLLTCLVSTAPGRDRMSGRASSNESQVSRWKSSPSLDFRERATSLARSIEFDKELDRCVALLQTDGWVEVSTPASQPNETRVLRHSASGGAAADRPAAGMTLTLVRQADGTTRGWLLRFP